MKKLAIVFLAALMILSFGPLNRAFAQGKVVRITLIDENGSGEDGSAQLTDLGDGTTKVELIMMNAPDGAVQPAHIHKGTCTNLDPNPAYPLNNVTDGKSTTTVKVSLADLGKEHYAINVHKSPTEATVYISCGILPLASASSSASMTMPQVFATLIDQANEVLGNIKNKEGDASKNALAVYHGTFAAHEADIKAKSAQAQSDLEEAMNEVQDNLNSGNYAQAQSAAEELITRLKETQASMAGSTSGTTASSPMADLQNAANDLMNEVKNSDKDGTQAAYTKFHDLFAANEAAIKAKVPDAQANIDNALNELNDAITAGDLSKAGAPAQEIVNEVNDATTQMAGSGDSDLPNGGEPAFPLQLVALIIAGVCLLTVGGAVRKRAN